MDRLPASRLLDMTWPDWLMDAMPPPTVWRGPGRASTRRLRGGLSGHNGRGPAEPEFDRAARTVTALS